MEDMENKIIGQDKIISQINSFDLDTCPRSIILMGKKGSGRHLISEYISNHLEVELVNLTNRLTLDTITNAMLSVEPKVYYIDTQNISVKSQNTILKFLEEPTSNCIIILLVENLSSLLDTVVNRCQVFELEKYDKSTLSLFADNEEILKYSETPGDVIELSGENFDEYKRLSSLILSSLEKASISNTLTLTDKFDSKTGELNLILFLKVFIKYIMDAVMNNSSKKYMDIYDLTNKLISDLKINSNQNRLMDKYLIELKSVMRFYED